VETFNDGKEGLKYLKSKIDDYDVVLLDILLPNIDGITILEELKRNNIHKKIIVLSSFKDDYTIRKIQTLEASYYMLKPIDCKVLEDRLVDILDEQSDIDYQKSESIEINVSSLLHDLGIPSHVRGYKYIRDGVLLLYSSDKMVTLVTKDIYPTIANKYETTSSRVERAIRHAIDICWLRGDLKLMEDLFGNSIDFDRSKPTNAEFLNTIADRFKMRKREIVG
jgi:two-component system response regulator (stage 0 sporulation protein A)